MDKVTFDYSRAEAFINPHEVAYMGRLAEDARKLLLSREGWIFPLIMIKKSLHGFRKQRRRFRRIPRF